MNQRAEQPILPVDVVFHPSWWNAHAGIVFDEDFFYHPKKRVESERRMEQTLYDRFGKYGLGADHGRDLPVVGPVHNAAGYLLSEMLGCEIRYHADSAPDVLPACRERLECDADAAFRSPAFRRYQTLFEALKTRYGSVCGDVNWSGVLNLALDVRGQELFLDMLDEPDAVGKGFQQLAQLLERFAAGMQVETGTSSVSVNRLVRHFIRPVFLHSECSNTMISAEDYERFILPIDAGWSERHRSFGIHHCGRDAHRFAASYAKVPHLDFLDVGWGSDVRAVRAHLPDTFLNLRLDPAQIAAWTPEEIAFTVKRLVEESGNPALTGVCCINMDQRVSDAQITAVFEATAAVRASAQREDAHA